VALPRRTLAEVASRAPDGGHVLDVGCNNGYLLDVLANMRVDLRIAGIDIDHTAVSTALSRGHDARIAAADNLPFNDASVDVVTMLDVIEHFPAERRAASVSEAWRVLKPGGALIIQTPHTGMFAFLDPQNLRHRFPQLYRRFIRGGVRDAAYRERQDVVWHHHFTTDELLGLVGAGWRVTLTRFPGFLLLPLADLFMWPFHRVRARSNRIARLLQRIGDWDSDRNYGPRLGYEVLLCLEKVPADRDASS
jgi:SAM-dependent methyltransferase